MLKINTKYTLTTPHATKTISINSEADKNYWKKYQAMEGFVFTEYTKPRIHISDSACHSCEG